MFVFVLAFVFVKVVRVPILELLLPLLGLSNIGRIGDEDMKVSREGDPKGCMVDANRGGL